MMYISSSIRYNAEKGDRDIYYRIHETFNSSYSCRYKDKSSHKDMGCMLDIGFLQEKLTHFQIKDISEALNTRWKEYEGYTYSVKDENTLKPKIKEYLDKFWNLMMESGILENVHQQKERELVKTENCVDTQSIKTFSLGKIGASWLLLQFLEKIELKEFLQKQGFTQSESYSALSCIIAFATTPSGPKIDYDFQYKDVLNETALSKLIEAFARDEVYQGPLPSYSEIISVPEKLFSIKLQLEEFLLSAVNRLCPQSASAMKRPASTIVEFDNYKSNNNLNKVARHRAVNLESVMEELYNVPRKEKTDTDWYTANLFVGWIWYVISSLIRNLLKKTGMDISWNNLLFKFETQTLSLFKGLNYRGEELSYCACTNPGTDAQKIYSTLGFKEIPPFSFPTY